MGTLALSAQASGFYAALHLDLAMIESGVPLDTLYSFLTDAGLEQKVIYDVVIPARTLKHRKAKAQALSQDESDKLTRFIRVFDEAVRVFGNLEKGRRWMSKPKHRFDERTPFDMLRTEMGARMVEEMLGQIDHGMFA